MIMQLHEDLQISIEREICLSMASDVWYIGKSDNLKSFVIKYAILVIHIHNWIELKYQRWVSQNKKHDDI